MDGYGLMVIILSFHIESQELILIKSDQMVFIQATCKTWVAWQRCVLHALLHHQNPKVTLGWSKTPRVTLPSPAKAPTTRRPTWNVQIRRSRCPRGFYPCLPCWYCCHRSGSRPGIHRCPTKLCSRIHLMIILSPIKMTIKGYTAF